MSRWVIVEDRTPKWCCGRCGVTRKEARRDRRECMHWGVKYDHHVWVWWEPWEPEVDISKVGSENEARSGEG